jgi:hypothetical protein
MGRAFWSETFFSQLIEKRDNWQREECPFTSEYLLKIAQSSNWLKAAIQQDKQFLKHKNDLTTLDPSYILDKVFGIDFLITFELEDDFYTFGIDVTSNQSVLKDKEYKANSFSRKDVRDKLRLDGFIVIGISETFESFPACSSREINYIAACIEQAVITGKSSIWIEK